MLISKSQEKHEYSYNQNMQKVSGWYVLMCVYIYL